MFYIIGFGIAISEIAIGQIIVAAVGSPLAEHEIPKVAVVAAVDVHGHGPLAILQLPASVGADVAADRAIVPDVL